MAAPLFSRDEAEAMLPQVAPLLWQAQRLKREHDDAQQQLAALEAKSRGNGHGIDAEIGRARGAVQKAATAINGIIERVRAMGIEVKDLDLGLIDFPSQMDGREVYLCWKLGEEHVAWWHELDTGYASRQPLE
ncbi:MAG TPA: DUF2203 domain-containing protein [Dehalococcoidia bacterium]|jgi:hypothetical protein|nr:DUF2203 domain-containing protein [Dehalococcoidia bacterium]